MTLQRAVAYTATPGYLFQTMLSAVQARSNVDNGTQVHVIAVAGRGDAGPELAVMASVAAAHNIIFRQVTPDVVDDLHPTFARLFLDRVLPKEIGTVLYLDGDTQVLGPLTPLLTRPPERGRLAGVLDPMAAIRLTHAKLRRQIDRDWDSAGMPEGARRGYVNAGVLLFDRADLQDFRAAALARYAEGDGRLPYADQDAINAALWTDIEHLELEWNYPGFLLGVDCPARAGARIIHYMSSPRPWHGSYLPWRRAGYLPYVELVREHPELALYWARPSIARIGRNHAQQLYKSCSEGRVWRSARFREALELLYPNRLLGVTGDQNQSVAVASPSEGHRQLPSTM